MVKKEKIIEAVNLTVPQPKVYRVTIKGANQLLFNKMPDQFQDKGERHGPIDHLAEEKLYWRNKAYQNDDGGLYIPGDNIHESLIAGTAYWGAKVEGNKKFTDLVSSAFLIQDMPLTTAGRLATVDDLQEYRKSVNRGTRGQKAMVPTIRPMLEDWGGTIDVTIFEHRVDVSILKVMFTYAGLYRGVLDWRPKFGRFNLVKIEEVK